MFVCDVSGSVHSICSHNGRHRANLYLCNTSLDACSTLRGGGQGAGSGKRALNEPFRAAKLAELGDSTVRVNSAWLDRALS